MIQVVNRALDILELVAKSPDSPKTLGEIAGELELNAGTCANIIKTLVQRGYLDKLDKQKGYILGPMAFHLSGNEGANKELIEAAKSELESLTKKLNENSLLTVLNGASRIAIYRTQGTNEVQATTPAEKPAYETTSGRLLIALKTDEELEKFIARYGLPSAGVWPEAATARNFKREVQKMRTEKCALQLTSGQIVGLAVPVHHNDKTIASLGVFMPVFRYKKEDNTRIISLMKKSADAITKKLS